MGRRILLAASLALVPVACGKEILIGADPSASDGSGDAGAGDGASSGQGGLEPLAVPWSTGFENGFGDWSSDGQGACYVTGAATYAIVMSPSPVHSGQYAAEFTVNPAVAAPSHTRCFRQGVLPPSAYYGAWYYVPPPVETNLTNWNLIHFEGAETPDAAAAVELWDLSLADNPDGGEAPSVYDFLRTRTLPAGPPIPIGQWFHLEARLVRSSTAGEFTVYLDGNVVLDLQGLETDPTAWGKWFVGNYATWLTPAPSTVYVDDVTISTTGP